MTCSLSVNRILRVEATSNRTNAVLQVFVTASGQLLGFVDASDALCKGQLKERSKELPSGSPWTTDAEFEAITVYFEPPSEDERFNVVRHERAQQQAGAVRRGSRVRHWPMHSRLVRRTRGPERRDVFRLRLRAPAV